MQETERFIRLNDGTIYGYSELLARRRDASIVDGYIAARWFRRQGLENDVTERYPEAEDFLASEPVPTGPAAKRITKNLRVAEAVQARAAKKAEHAERLKVMKERRLAAETPAVNDEDPESSALREKIQDLFHDEDRT